MFLEAQTKQFTLKDDGQIYFQPDSTNPLPGEPLARVQKGEGLLQPSVVLIEGRDLGGEDPASVTEHVATWLKAHIYTVLEPLFGLLSDENMAEPVKEIALKLFAGMGIVSRGTVEQAIAQLDPEMRKSLRDKKVRLGPLLIFIPDLNKPAAVRLRAMLWCLHHGVALPAPLPRDGAMSSVVDVTTANPDFYRAIGYPLYGPRVIRIDMLDRVINAVYDGAKDGKFQAQHKMAEWMGCPIADLYAILEAMGHRRIVNDVVATPASAVPETVVEPTPPVAVAETSELPAPAADTVTTEIVEVKPKPEQKKPELDWFMLRRGKAHAERPARPARTERVVEGAESGEKPERRPFKKPFQKSEDKKPFPAERYAAKGAKPERKRDDGEFQKKKHSDRNKDHKSNNDRARVFTAEASFEDNPFAVLQNLKLK